jgi:Fe-S cluster assembly scaffold protein SufB
MSPAQRVSSIPAAAGHGASIFHPSRARLRYLETAGLTGGEAAELLNRVFLEEAG